MYKQHVRNISETRRNDLRTRLGPTLYRQRQNLQLHHSTHVFDRHGQTFTHLENVETLHTVLRLLLKATGLYGLGLRNFLDIRVEENEFRLAGLPRVFDGFTILQLSDLHLDLEPRLCEAISERIEGLEYDLCVITGDFRDKTIGSFTRTRELMAKVMPHIRPPAYAILGNHDFIEIVPDLEEMGLRFLLNENAMIERDGAAIYLVGIDDPHFYETDNFEGACRDVPHDAVTLLLAHTPEVYRQAAACGLDIMLCGHTHGGQICLPGGLALVHNTVAPRRMNIGAWQFNALQGYTSRGTGSSGVPARFNCPPEVTLHRLKRA